MTDVEARDDALHDTKIDVEVPAAGEYLSVLRTAAAGLAARMDFTLDDIEDLRIAVDEASSMLLAQANPGSRLSCRFVLGGDTVTFSASVRSRCPQLPSRDGFAWTVLTALASSVDVRLTEPDLLTIELTRRRPDARG
ncbi:anti-sigma regulatory factor [soil metagenome]